MVARAPRSDAPTWSSVLAWLAALVAVGLFLSGLGRLLDLPAAPPGTPHATQAISTTANAALLAAIEQFWRLKDAPRLVATFLAVDTVVFIPLYVMVLVRLRALLRARGLRGIGEWLLGRPWRLALAALVLADLGENLLIAVDLFGLREGDDSLHGALRMAGWSKWGLAGAVLILSAAAALARNEAIRWRAGVFDALVFARDVARYLWLYFVPLAMVLAGIGVIAAVPQTRELLEGIRARAPEATSPMIMGVLALIAWLACCAVAFRLLDGAASDVPVPGVAPPAKLRARHQLLLGLATVLSTTQLLASFVPAASAQTALVMFCAGVATWLLLVALAEFAVRVLALPVNASSRAVRTGAVGWTCGGLLLLAWWRVCLPVPDETTLIAFGVFLDPNAHWRFKPTGDEMRALLASAAALLALVLVLRGLRRSGPSAPPGGRGRVATALAGAALMAGVLFATIGWRAGLALVLLVGVLTLALWVSTRHSAIAAYLQWWDSRAISDWQVVRRWVPGLPEVVHRLGAGFVRRQLEHQLNAPRNLLIMMLLIAIVAGNFAPPQTAIQLGTLAIVFLGVGAWGLAITWLFVCWPRRHGLGNWMLVALVWPLVMAPSAGFRPERVARADPLAAKAPPLPTLHTHYEAWRDGLPDRTKSPTFVVAAAGGGLRAAYWTAMLLAEMDDRTCGQFGRHVMAESGVSGGSLGLALYAAQRRVWESKPVPARCVPGRSAEMRLVLRNDYLSPVMASLFFGDLPQSYVPWRYRGRDRNDALSDALVSMWQRAFPQAPGLLSQPMATAIPALSQATGTSTADGLRQPMVFLNATSVETGRRAIASNVQMLELPADRLLAENGGGLEARPMTADWTLLDAALASARFPGVSPAGTLWGCSRSFDGRAESTCEGVPQAMGVGSEDHVVDGGFFENSGLETIRDMLAGLRSRRSLTTHHDMPPVFLIAISNDEDTRRLCGSGRSPTARMPVLGRRETDIDAMAAVMNQGLATDSDVRSHTDYDGPFTAGKVLLSVRNGRARLELRRSIIEMGCPYVVEWSLGDELKGAEPALGWMLSAASFDRMDAAVSRYADAFPFDQAACAPRSTPPRGFIGGPNDEAKRCLPEPPATPFQPLTPDSILRGER